jgi:hemerythrin
MQHKELVNMLNDLYDAMRAGKANDVLGEILTRMRDTCWCTRSRGETDGQV